MYYTSFFYPINSNAQLTIKNDYKLYIIDAFHVNFFKETRDK